ncbi:Uncharacterized protein YvpB [Oceanobacillus limi]|uniref:Uncharacterized protein YvpB n=1 Tax=Oceanobacillus limi TaxID=930131 RepID=A0A1I0CI61_9BACI|nr:C39 family peptidase [Oceanobacillus limi]SET18821.1 Uncharacterized protein YvpB [Oceanobacillus limi]
MANDEMIKIDGVPIDYQYPDLPTGCEATALSILLRWANVDTDKFDVADNLPKGREVHEVNGKWYGANPNETFVGDPYSDGSSYGVFEKPILATIEKYLPGKGVNLTGKNFNDILQIVKNGKPVMTWTTLKQKDSYYAKSWEDNHGNIIDWYNNEHAVVIVGYDSDFIIVHDPDTGKEEHYLRERFKKNWESMGKRSVTLDVS